MLAALTERETGRTFDAGSGVTRRFPVEPRSQYGVFRLQKDFAGGTSVAGLALTAMHRDLPQDGSFDDLVSSAYGLGLDFEKNWGGSDARNWALWGFIAGSLVSGSRSALLNVQEASNHYFQRPDATRLSVDSTATSLSGRDWRLQFERRSAKHWTGAIWLGETTAGLEANDLGFSQTSERMDGGARISYQEITPGSIFNNYELRLFTFHNWRHEALDDPFSLSSWSRAHKNGTISARAEGEFVNFWEIELEARYSPEVLSDRDTRGGPLMIQPASTRFRASFNTDRRRVLSFEPELEYENRHRGGYRLSTDLELEFRPSPSLEIVLNPSYSVEVDPAQYVDATEDVGFEPTYGRRYVFSDLKRHTLSMVTRLNVAFNPYLTLQLFAQPLLSSGEFLTHKQLGRSESFEFDTFEEGTAVVSNGDISCVGGRTCVTDDERYIDFDADGETDFSFSDGDFNIRSLRLNAVLRWEYRPGSTLFFVWQQGRLVESDIGVFDFGGDVGALWDAPAENTFIVKVSYWLGL